jgi:hypothetical protein
VGGLSADRLKQPTAENQSAAAHRQRQQDYQRRPAGRPPDLATDLRIAELYHPGQDPLNEVRLWALTAMHNHD